MARAVISIQLGDVVNTEKYLLKNLLRSECFSAFLMTNQIPPQSMFVLNTRKQTIIYISTSPSELAIACASALERILLVFMFAIEKFSLNIQITKVFPSNGLFALQLDWVSRQLEESVFDGVLATSRNFDSALNI